MGVLEGFLILVAVVGWIVASLYRAARWVIGKAKPGLAPALPVVNGPLPPQEAPSQALPVRAPSLLSPRPRPRQPSAGGPAVPRAATSQDFRQQEQELMAEEPTALGVSLTPSPPPAIASNALFQTTDDLVRAVILQQVLAPPLSKRPRASNSIPLPLP